MPDLIFVSMENWDEIWRRNQFVCAELARRHPEMKILFIGLARDVSNDLRHGKLTTPGRREIGETAPENVVVMRPWKLLPNSIAAGRVFNQWMFRRQVRRMAAALGMHEPLLWLNPHSAVHMVNRMGEQGVIYDITDDWTTLSQSPRLIRLITAQDAELCRRADAVIVCSRRLFEMKQGMAGNLHLIPNGVHADHYRRVLDDSGPLPAIAASWRKPVLGYVGTIHPDRVDADLVETLAKRMPDSSLVLVGPDHMPPAIVERFDRCGNIFRTGPVVYDEVPNYMRAFDVCITPHRVTPFTESLQPIKLWEYLAAGKPIVSTDVAGFRDYPGLVTIARTAEEFASAVRLALSEDNSIAEARRAEARTHSWQARVDEIESVLADAVARRAERGRHPAKEVFHAC